MAYYKRVADKLLKEKLEAKGAILVTGAKWCGKTSTSLRIAKSTLFMQDPQTKKQNIAIAELNPMLLLEGDVPRLIDEWQIAPQLWDAVRFEVDKRNEFSQFILTGSATPVKVLDNSHTGLGRIGRLKMRPMSLFESLDSNGSVSLCELFMNREIMIQGTCDLELDDLAFLICRGGWPRSIGYSERIALQQAIDYFEGLIETDISKVDGVHRNPERAKRLLRSLARFVGSQAKLSSILEDMKSNESSTISDKTIRTYIEALNNIFVLENSVSWNPQLRSKTAVRTSDTRYFTDPSIATAALGVGPKDLINDLETMGFLFENMCIRDLRIYSEILNGSVYHYRDKSNLECDAVIHLRNGSYALIEIKLGGHKLIELGASNLNKLENVIDTSKMKKPAFKMIIVGVGKYAYQRKDGIYIVPIGCLKP